MEITDKIAQILNSLIELLQTKNKKYGNSALEPLNIFSKEDAKNSILIRLDDKLSRVKNSTDIRKNDICDIMGYLTLLCINQNFNDFKDLID